MLMTSLYHLSYASTLGSAPQGHLLDSVLCKSIRSQGSKAVRSDTVSSVVDFQFDKPYTSGLNPYLMTENWDSKLINDFNSSSFHVYIFDPHDS